MTGLPDLHRHLDGSLRPATVAALAHAQGVAVPHHLPFTPGMGLAAALERFAFTVGLLQHPDAVRRVADELCQDAAAEGVTTLEVRFAPQLHRGGLLYDVVDAALEGIDGRAGLVLCALYGQHPSKAEALVAVAEGRPGVVGLDLAGGPAPGHRYGMADYRAAFTEARDRGLGRTVHAGEGRPAAEIAAAILTLHAQRIGHGLSVLDDPNVAALVRSRRVTLEACPTSNRHTGVLPADTPHPLAAWLKAGIRACINTDNTLFSQVDAPTEHARAGALPEMTPALLQQAVAFGHAAAFRRTEPT